MTAVAVTASALRVDDMVIRFIARLLAGRYLYDTERYLLEFQQNVVRSH
jgi:hypothetical protein